MAEDTELNENTIIPILDDLRKPNGKRPRNGKVDPNKKLKTFADIVSDQWENLGIEGAPNPKLLELMIIKAVDSKYGDWKNKEGAKQRRQTAKSFDATLLSFGLLKKYPHTKGNANTWLEDRYREYLIESIYIEIEYPGDGTYKEIEKKAKTKKPVKQPRQLNTFGKNADKGKEGIAPELFEMIKNKTYKEYLGENGDVIAYEIPEPCFISKNYQFLVEQEDESKPCQSSVEDALSQSDNSAGEAEGSGKTEGQAKKEAKASDEGHEDEPINPNPPKPSPPEAGWLNATITNFKMKLPILKELYHKNAQKPEQSFGRKSRKNKQEIITVLIRLVGIVGVTSIGALIIILVIYFSDRAPELCSIRFDNPEETLVFGGDLYLTVIPTPSDAKLDDLKCETEGDEDHILEVLSESKPHIKAVAKSKYNKEYYVRIIAYIENNKKIMDKMTVHVIPNQGSKSADEDESQNETPGSFQKSADIGY